jgi:iron complex outermembrane receptor protein
MDSDVYSGGAVLFPKGGRLNFSPEYTAGLSLDYAFPLGSSGLGGRLFASGNYISEQDNRVLLGSTVVIGRGDPTYMSRAGFSLTSNGGWAATLFCDNLSNYQESPIPGYGGFPLYRGRVQPRTVGLQLEYRH